MEVPSPCTQLGSWLSAAAWQAPAGIEAMAAHIYACPLCRHGRIELPGNFRSDSDLTHDQCQGYFPTYYEATNPEYPLASMPDAELVAVTLHLATCAKCREIYDGVCLLSELEERNEDAG
jgi:hypothetical protein